MKILKYILITIVTLVVLFLAIGLLKSEVNYGAEITVTKPLNEAWAVSEDDSKYALWLDGFKSMELISGQYGEVGSKYRIIVNPGEGQPDFEMIETVISREEFDHVSMSFDSEMMDFEQTITFTEEDGAVNIKTDSKVIGKSIPMRSMFAIMEMAMGAFEKQEAKNMNALKKVIEENETDYYPIPIIEEADSLVTDEASL